jgi:uncharacterized protein (DUF2267 family)
MAHALQCPHDPERAVRIFRSVLHTLRDCLPLESAIDVLRVLPGTLKSIYIENWIALDCRVPIKSSQHFVNAVREHAGKIAFYDFPTEALTEDYIRTVLQYIENEVSHNKLAFLQNAIPFLPAISKSYYRYRPFTTVYSR